MGRYVAEKNSGLECNIATFPRLDVTLYIKATIIIYIEPRSLPIALNGSNIPCFAVFILSKYAPIAVSNIPTIPNLSSLSPRMRFDVKIINIGLNAKNGKVMDKGDILIAFIYNMSAIISNGSKISIVTKKHKSNLGTAMKGRINSKKGEANPTCTQATRYSLLLKSDFLQRASADAEKKAQSRDNMSQFKANHQ